MDEHDPYYVPPQVTWMEFFRAIGRCLLLALAVGMVVELIRVFR